MSGSRGEVEQRLSLALEAGRLGTWQWDVASGRVTWSPELERAHGIPEGSFGGTFEDYQRDIHPEDRERVLATISSTLRERRDHHLEYRIIRPDGEVRWLDASGTVLLDSEGNAKGMIGVCADVTERKTAEAARHDSEAWLATTLASIGDAVIATDANGLVRFSNAVADELTGWPPADARGRHIDDVFRIFNEETREVVESPVARVLREGMIVGLANHTILVRRDGSEISIDDSAAPIRNENGAITGVVLVFRDVTHKRREEMRHRFIADATRLLAASLDDDAAFEAIGRIAVPHIADWCGVDILAADGSVRRVVVAHVDPAKVALAHELHRRYPPDPNAQHGLYQVLRTGKPELVPDIPDELLVQATIDEEHLRLARSLGLRSYLIMPIRSSNRTLGAVSFVTTGTNRRLDTRDLELAEQLCNCAGIAIENARLYQHALLAQKSAEAAVSRTTALQAVTSALASAGTVEEVARVATDTIFQRLRARGIALFSAEGGELHLRAHRGLDPAAAERWRVFPYDSEVLLARALQSRTAIWLEDREAMGEAGPIAWAAESLSPDINSCAALPLIAQDRILGGIAISFTEPQHFEVGARELMLTMTDQFAQALDRAQLREMEQRARGIIEESESRYRYIFESAAVGLAEKDYTLVKRRLDGAIDVPALDLEAYFAEHPEVVEEALDLVRIRAVNPAMLRLFRADDPEQLVSLRSIFVPESRAPFARELAALLRGEKLVSIECPLRTLDGERIVVLSTIAFPAFGFDQVLISRTDITPQRRMLEEKEELVTKLQQSMALTETFAGVLGHDLRNPLGAIMNSAHLALRVAGGEQLRRPLTRILSSGERMARMIEQLLDFSRIRVTGGVPITPKEAELGPLVRQVLGELETAYPESTLRLDLSGDMRGFWDTDRLAQVISNLTANAIQHGIARAPVHAELDGTERDNVVLRLHNEGEIPTHILPNLFDAFRGAHQRRDGTQGLGLGLFITQQIVLAHGGTLDVSSSAGRTSIIVTLPRRTPTIVSSV